MSDQLTQSFTCKSCKIQTFPALGRIDECSNCYCKTLQAQLEKEQIEHRRFEGEWQEAIAGYQEASVVAKKWIARGDAAEKCAAELAVKIEDMLTHREMYGTLDDYYMESWRDALDVNSNLNKGLKESRKREAELRAELDLAKKQWSGLLVEAREFQLWNEQAEARYSAWRTMAIQFALACNFARIEYVDIEKAMLSFATLVGQMEKPHCTCYGPQGAAHAPTCVTMKGQPDGGREGA